VGGRTALRFDVNRIELTPVSQSFAGFQVVRTS
jgi:hypothetical protein